jgi:hypothetical protein
MKKEIKDSVLLDVLFLLLQIVFVFTVTIGTGWLIYQVCKMLT